MAKKYNYKEQMIYEILQLLREYGDKNSKIIYKKATGEPNGSKFNSRYKSELCLLLNEDLFLDTLKYSVYSEEEIKEFFIDAEYRNLKVRISLFDKCYLDALNLYREEMRLPKKYEQNSQTIEALRFKRDELFKVLD